MKIAPKLIDQFIRKPSAEARAVLLYGPDEGLVRERMNVLAGKDADVSDVTPEQLNEAPSRLLDEAQSFSMFGGKKVVRLRDASDKQTPFLKSALEALRDGDNFVLVSAGELTPRSSLRMLFENAPNAAAVPCYVEDARDIARVIADALREAGYSFSGDVVPMMAANVVGDRGVARSEVEKLITYIGKDRKTVTLEDITACVGDSAELSLDDLARHVASGNFAEAERILNFSLAEGLPAVTALRNLQNHFMKLHMTKARMENGESLESALGKLRPPLFFKIKPAFEAQVRGWTLAQIESALFLLASAEAKCKQSANDPATLCGRAILSLSQVGARAVRR